MVEKGYYGNKGFVLPWDCIKVPQVDPFTTTDLCNSIFFQASAPNLNLLSFNFMESRSHPVLENLCHNN